MALAEHNIIRWTGPFLFVSVHICSTQINIKNSRLKKKNTQRIPQQQHNISQSKSLFSIILSFSQVQDKKLHYIQRHLPKIYKVNVAIENSISVPNTIYFSWIRPQGDEFSSISGLYVILSFHGQNLGQGIQG